MAYGARLESVLGASPRGFESPILRHSRFAPFGTISPARAEQLVPNGAIRGNGANSPLSVRVEWAADGTRQSSML